MKTLFKFCREHNLEIGIRYDHFLDSMVVSAVGHKDHKSHKCSITLPSLWAPEKTDYEEFLLKHIADQFEIGNESNVDPGYGRSCAGCIYNEGNCTNSSPCFKNGAGRYTGYSREVKSYEPT